MLRTRTKPAAVICGGAAVLLLMAGCQSAGQGAADSPEVPSIGTSTSSATLSPTSAAPPTTVPPPPNAAEQPAPQPNTVASGECKVADLTLSLGGGDTAAGTTYRSLRFTNSGGRTCTIQGFPGVSYVTGDDGHQVGPSAKRDGAKGAPITLHPGEVAHADIGFVQVRNYEPAACNPTEVRGLRIYPPHEYDSMFVPNPGTGCASTPPGNQLVVKTIEPGPGA
jgi:hypothetical protein